ncbi:MAG: CotH kinase family protein [Bacteroidales bacterium]|nr:CotH kinase family protein [Bacteroidales bacterium]
MRKTLLSLFLITFLLGNVNSQVFINEFLSSNLNIIEDEDFEYCDWIELYNASGTPVNLESYTISDDILSPSKWSFPAISISPNSHLLIMASDKDRTASPVSYNTIIDVGDGWKFIVPEEPVATEWKSPGFNDSAWSIGKSGFGYGDNDDSTDIGAVTSVYIRKEFELTNIENISKLVLNIDYDDGFVAYLNGNEIARDNLGTYGEEILYNQTTNGLQREATIYQNGSLEYYFTDNPSEYLIEGTNAIAIQCHNVNETSSDMSLIPILSIGRAGETQENETSSFIHLPNSYLHTNFKLRASGEGIYLFNSSGVLIDSVGATELTDDISFGRKPDGSEDWLYFGFPTPGKPNNNQGVTQLFADTVVFSHQGGRNIGGLVLSLSSSNPADSIYYTLDGSVPDKTDILYTSPFIISNNTVVRARVIDYLSLPGKISTNTYVTNIDHEFPVVCISTEPDNLWDYESGIYVMGPNAQTDYPYFNANFWQNWEKPAHMELYDQAGIKQIDQGAGIRIYGAWSRAHDLKSFAVFARSQYGEGSFNYKFFADKPIDKFESIVLRNSGNDDGQCHFLDGFITGLTEHMNADRQAMQPASIYLNGEYWGILNIREKINEHFVAENHGVDPEQVNILELESNIIQGTNEDYLEILDFLNTNSSLQNNDKYNWMQDRIDIDNYIQYQLAQIYADNKDWPGNNIKFWNSSIAKKWRWIIYDTDFGFGANGSYTFNTLSFALVPDNGGWPNPTWSTLLFRRMVTNIGFRHNFINQYCDRLNLDFYPDRVRFKLDSLQSLYEPEMPDHFNRWGGNMSSWEDRIRDKRIFGNNRPTYSRTHIKEVFNLDNQLVITVNVSNTNAGRVKINTIIPNEYPFEGVYFENVPIKLTAVPRPGFKFTRWEGSSNQTDIEIDYDMREQGSFTAIFEVADASDISVIVNEISYCSSIDHDTKDWVEILNNGQTTIDLNGWIITDSEPDSGFVFNSSYILTPGEYLVICREKDDFEKLYPMIDNIVGDLPFGFSSNGDFVRIFDAERNLINGIRYLPYTPWPEVNCSEGRTIELINPSLDNTRGENWQVSDIGGTPGDDNYNYIITDDIHTEYAVISGFECFPNPFSDFTTIQFNVTVNDNYRLEVYDMNGKLVNILVDEYLTENIYYYDWFGTGSNNEYLPGGIYHIRLSCEFVVQNIKVILIR